ncbi:MAG: sigma-54 dependent transcriptional regulator [Proteobacteria bacterium]|nr:sigma-54 dependent transcriptional regulator [Pseudomonadota bacterium]
MTEIKTILVVDGNQASKRERSAILENRGCHVVSSHDKPDALLRMEKTSFVLVILCSDAPGMGTEDFIIQAGERCPDQDVLVISRSISVDEAVSAMKAGALDYIVEPVSPDQLLSYVDKVLKGREGKTGDGKERVKGPARTVRIITGNAAMKDLMDMVDRVAESTASILIQGESGTGKEMFARYLHEKSRRNKGPFVAVNCAALPENLLESELFGHEKGAFTGAISRKAGKFEQADGGTLLLDEITEMQVHLQSKLLRVIQEKEVDRVGGGAPVAVDVRIVATTNRNILESVEKGNFREDLYYRLNVIPLTLPPLRDRIDDIPILAAHFIRKFNALDSRNVKCLTKEGLDCLKNMPLKGNVRELENILQRAVLLARTDTLTDQDLLFGQARPQGMGPSPGTAMLPDELLSSPLRDVERKMIFHTLGKTGGNRTHAANILGISVRTLRNKLHEYKDAADLSDDDAS